MNKRKLVIAICFIFSTALFSQAKLIGVEVTKGEKFKGGASNHSGYKMKFLKSYKEGITYITITDNTYRVIPDCFKIKCDDNFLYLYPRVSIKNPDITRYRNTIFVWKIAGLKKRFVEKQMKVYLNTLMIHNAKR